LSLEDLTRSDVRFVNRQRARARALDLDFVSIEWECYDLIIPKQFYESELLEPLLALIRGGTFRKVEGELKGYDASGMGEVVLEE
jgi:putative molybdopterin biosynthesis protein